MKSQRTHWTISLFMIVMAMGASISGCESATETATATATTEEVAAATAEPTATETPLPTETSLPTATTTPTIEPSATATPTATPSPTPPPTDTATPVKVKASATPIRSKPETATPAANTGSGDTQPPDALTVIQKAETRVEELDTVQFRQIIEVNFAEVTQNVQQDCAVETPTETTYCQSSTTFTIAGQEPITVTTELVEIGETIWVREEGQEWEQLPAAAVADSGGVEQLHMSHFITEADIEGETTIDNVAVYEISYSLDVEAYFTTILGDEMAELFGENAGDYSGAGRVWIGKDDQLMRKSLVEMTLPLEGQTMTLTNQTAAFGFNEPVNIPDLDLEEESG